MPIKNLNERFKAIRAQAMAEAKKNKKNSLRKEIRVLGVSGSARDTLDMARHDSNSEWLLNQALDELKKLGAKTKILKLREKNIHPCKACYSTVNTQCHYKCTCYPEGKGGDDMTNEIYDLCSEADIILFATPVNNFKISTYMALFIDRLISMDGSLSPADPNNPKNVKLNQKHARFVEKNAKDDIPGSGYLRRFYGKVGGILVTGHEAGASLTIASLFLTLNHYGFLFPPYSNLYAVTGQTDATDADPKQIRTPGYTREARLVARNLMTAAKLLKTKKDYNWTYNCSTD